MRLKSLAFRVVLGVFLLFNEASAAEPSAARKVLFFDLWKLDKWENLSLQLGKPKWDPDCDYSESAVPSQGIYSPSIWFDEERGQWQMLYSTQWAPLTLMLASSSDGVNWKPLRVDNDISPKLADHHVLTVPSGSGSVAYQDPMRTDGYAFRIFGKQSGRPVLQRARQDSSHRWYEASMAEDEKRYVEEGIQVVSRDGIHWELKTGEQWDWHTTDWYPEPPVFMYWNSLLKKHVMVARPGWGDRRQCLRMSSDLQHWSEPMLELQPDALDAGAPIGMYGMPVHPVGNGAGYVGLLWIFHNSSSQRVDSFNRFYGTLDAQLAYSYDGRHFFRSLREPFIELNPLPQPGCSQIRPCSMIERDDEIWIYSQADQRTHGRERQQLAGLANSGGTLMLHRLRKDGWTYLTSQGDWAHLQTKPFALLTEGIRINAAAPFGEVRFQLTDEQSEPIPGFRFEDCVPLRHADSLSHPLAWRGDADWQNVMQRPIRLEIKMRQTKLYSLEMKHHFIDAHDMWLLKDGKSLPDRRRFDF